MNFAEYIGAVERENAKVKGRNFKLSDVKKAMLERLWQEGGPGFPRGWVASKELNDISGQSEFARRLRELQRNEGCDLEERSNYYRLKSPEVSGATPRGYLTESQKKTLFEAQNYQCQICGKQMDWQATGKAAPQADHKRPLTRGGGDEWANWQTLCNDCNVAKRGACHGCREDCEQCPWAYPEKFGVVVSVGLPKDLYAAALSLTDRGSRPEVGELLADALRDQLDRE